MRTAEKDRKKGQKKRKKNLKGKSMFSITWNKTKNVNSDMIGQHKIIIKPIDFYISLYPGFHAKVIDTKDSKRWIYLFR